MSERVKKSDLRFASTVAKRAASVALLSCYAVERAKGMTDDAFGKRLNITGKEFRRRLLSTNNDLDRLSTMAFACGGYELKLNSIGGLVFFHPREIPFSRPIDPMETAYDDSFFTAIHPP